MAQVVQIVAQTIHFVAQTVQIVAQMNHFVAKRGPIVATNFAAEGTEEKEFLDTD